MTTSEDKPLRVVVLGAGRMGAGLAAQYARAGHDVVVTTSWRTGAEQALARVRDTAGDTEGSLRLRWAETTEQACAGAEVVVESLPEDVTTKQVELARAQRVAPGALLGTNTSSLRVSEIARGLPEPSALAGTHYLNPPELFRVVELVPGEDTDTAVLERFAGILTDLGLRPIRLREDTPGFVINRLQFALLREAAELVDAGVASAEDVDRLVAEGLAPRWVAAGPLATAAVGGGRLFDSLAERLYPVLSQRTIPEESLAKQHPDPETVERVRRDRHARLTRVLQALSSEEEGAQDSEQEPS